MTVYGMLPPSEAFPKARAAVLQALEIDERSGKSHDMLAIIKWLYDWDGAGAEAEFRRGHVLDPNVDDFAYGTFLAAKGRMADAISEFERTVSVNPGKVTTHLFFASVLADAGRLDDALHEAQTYADRSPVLGHMTLGSLYLRMGKL